MITRKRYYPWLVVALLVVVSLLNYLDRQMLATMRPYMMADIRELESITAFGRLMAVFLWIYALMSPLSGMIADRLDRKWLIVGSLFVWSAVTLAMGSVDTIGHLYLLRGVMGLSEAFYIPAALSLAADYHRGKTRALALGILTSGIYLGQAVGGFGATLAAVTSWRFTFHAFGLVGILYSLVLIALLREKKVYAAAPARHGSFACDLHMAGKGLAVLFSNVAFWVMLFYFATLNLPGWTTKNWLPTMLSESLGLGMEYAGPLATTTLALSSFAGVFLGGALSDRWVQRTLRGRIYTSSAGLALIVPALLLMTFGRGIVPSVAAAVIFGVGFGMFDTNNMPILCQFVPSRYRATGYGIMNLAGISAGALITNELGRAIEAGYQQWVFVGMVAAVSVAILLQLEVLHPVTEDMTDEVMERIEKQKRK